MYYLRTKPAADAIKFTVDQKALEESEKQSKVVHSLIDTKTFEKRTNHFEKRVSNFEKRPSAFDNSEGTSSGDDGEKEPGDEEGMYKDIEEWRKQQKKKQEALLCSLTNKEACTACSS